MILPNRILKESICTSEDIDSLSPQAEILFYRLIVRVDDYGLYFGNEKLIKSICYPLKSNDIKDSQVISWLSELQNSGLIFFYIADDGKKYLKLTNWHKHQQIRAQKSKFPMPDINGNQMISIDCKCPRNPIQSNPILNENPNPYSEADAVGQSPPPAKIKYGQYGWVKLTEEQYQKLIKDHGEQTALHYITVVDESAQQTGNKNKWKDWNLTVRKAIKNNWGDRSNGTDKQIHTTGQLASGDSSGDRPSFGIVLR